MGNRLEIFQKTVCAATEAEKIYKAALLSYWQEYSGADERGDVIVDEALDLLYTFWSTRFNVVNITNLASPSLVGQITSGIPTGSSKMIIDGNYAYLGIGNAAANSQLRIVDISTPATPTIVGGTAFDLGGYGIGHMDKYGDYLFAVIYDLALQTFVRVIDVSDPANPVVVGNCETFDVGVPKCQGIAINETGTVACLTFESSMPNAFRTIDISNPLVLASLSGTVVSHTEPRSPLIVDDYCYTVSWFPTSGLGVMDISTPASPVLVAEIPLPNSGKEMRGISRCGNLLGLGMYTSASYKLYDSFRIVDISNRAAPILKSYGSVFGVGGKPRECYSSAIFGDGRYVILGSNFINYAESAWLGRPILDLQAEQVYPSVVFS